MTARPRQILIQGRVGRVVGPPHKTGQVRDFFVRVRPFLWETVRMVVLFVVTHAIVLWCIGLGGLALGAANLGLVEVLVAPPLLAVLNIIAWGYLIAAFMWGARLTVSRRWHAVVLVAALTALFTLAVHLAGVNEIGDVFSDVFVLSYVIAALTAALLDLNRRAVARKA